jgi:hypothetical protein
MSNLGYFQLKAAPGVWDLSLAPGPSSDVFSIQTAPPLLAAGHATRVLGAEGRRLALEPEALLPARALRVTMADFSGQHVLLLAAKRPGKEAVSILDDEAQTGGAEAEADRAGMMGSVSKWWSSGAAAAADEDATVHIFSLASGHLYERFLKIMMQSVLEKTQRRVKFWLLKNFLSPAFIGALPALARELGFEYGLVQYQWPSWLHKQTDKQRIIWGYKILFLDVMFPLSVKRIIYIDADQVSALGWRRARARACGTDAQCDVAAAAHVREDNWACSRGRAPLFIQRRSRRSLLFLPPRPALTFSSHIPPHPAWGTPSLIFGRIRRCVARGLGEARAQGTRGKEHS